MESIKKIKENITKIIFNFIQFFELIVSVIIAIVAIFMLFNLISQILETDISLMTSSDFSTFLSSMLTVVVGLEFVKLLCRHKIENLIDVLMLAISRQMVVEHLDTLQMLIGVISVILLIVVKKIFKKDKIGKSLLASKKDNREL